MIVNNLMKALGAGMTQNPEVDLGTTSPVTRRQFLDKFLQVGVDLLARYQDKASADSYEKMNNAMRDLFALPETFIPITRPFGCDFGVVSRIPLDDLRFSEWGQDELYHFRLVMKILDSVKLADRETFYVSGIDIHSLARSLCVFHAVSVVTADGSPVVSHRHPEVDAFYVSHGDTGLAGTIMLCEDGVWVPPVWWRANIKAVVVVEKETKSSDHN